MFLRIREFWKLWENGKINLSSIEFWKLIMFIHAKDVMTSQKKIIELCHYFANTSDSSYSTHVLKL